VRSRHRNELHGGSGLSGYHFDLSGYRSDLILDARKVSRSDHQAIFSSNLKKAMLHLRHVVLALNRLQ
jgi:hypothetical protein